MKIPREVSGRPVTNRGVHLHPNGLHNYWMENHEYWTTLMADMSISWCLAMSESDNVLISGAAEALLKAGIIPIVRFAYQFPNHFTEMDATERLSALYDKYGAPCIIQFANEPFDPREWKDGKVPPKDEAWQIIADRWNEAARLIIERGAVPGFPDGPTYGENPFFRVGDPYGFWVDGKAVYLGHFYGKGRPGTYPYDDVSRYGVPLTMEEYRWYLDDFADDPAWNEGEAVLAMMNQQRAEWADPNLTAVKDAVCWRGWERVVQYSQDAFGFTVPMAMTEGGWVPRDRAGSNPVDIRWPYTTPKMVAKKTLAMYQDDSPCFAICPWLLADGYMAGGGDVGWPYDAWVTWAYNEEYGIEKPVVQMLRDNPPTPIDLEAARHDLREAKAAAERMLIHLGVE